MDRHFDGDLKGPGPANFGMGALCETMIQKTVKALIDRDSALTQEVFSLEDRGQPASTWKSTTSWSNCWPCISPWRWTSAF
jgi:hypothetical protein